MTEGDERELFENWVKSSHPMGHYLKNGAIFFDDKIEKYQIIYGTSDSSNQMQCMWNAWQARAIREIAND